MKLLVNHALMSLGHIIFSTTDTMKSTPFHNFQTMDLMDSSFSFVNNTIPYSQMEALRLTAGITAILSIFGSLFIIISSAVFKDIAKSLASRLIWYLSLSDMLASCAYIIRLSQLDEANSELGNMACKAEAFMMTTFEMSSVLWSSCICIHLFLIIILPNWRVEKLEPLYHIVSWGYPLVWSSIVLAFDRFGRASNWCWIIPDEPHDYFSWRFFTFLPIYMLLLFNMSMYVCVCFSLRKMLQKSRQSRFPSNLDRRREVKALRRLSMVVIAFFITWIPPIINRLVEGLYPFVYYFWLDLAQAFTNPLQGFLNMLLYGFGFIPRYIRAFKSLKNKIKKKRTALHETKYRLKRQRSLSQRQYAQKDTNEGDPNLLTRITSASSMSGYDSFTETEYVFDIEKSGCFERFIFHMQYYLLCICCQCCLIDSRELESKYNIDSLYLEQGGYQRKQSTSLQAVTTRGQYNPTDSETEDEDSLPFVMQQGSHPSPEQKRHRQFLPESSGVRTGIHNSQLMQSPDPVPSYPPDSVTSSLSSSGKPNNRFDVDGGISSLADSVPFNNRQFHSRYVFDHSVENKSPSTSAAIANRKEVESPSSQKNSADEILPRKHIHPRLSSEDYNIGYSDDF